MTELISVYSMLADSLSRPRVLYSSIYSWISVTGGRFMGPFLRTLGLTDMEIGVALALQLAIMTALGPWGGRVAEALEREYPGRGRIYILTTGIIYATMEYLMNALEFENKVCYIALCGLYTVGVAMVFPALDGITNEFLECSPNPEEDLARERLYGAIWWAFTNLYMSMALDWYGFHVTYPMAAISAVTVLFSVCIYSYKQNVEKEEEGSDTKVNSRKSSEQKDLDKEKVKRLAPMGDPENDNDTHSDTCTETTATTRHDSDTEEMSSRSEHGSDVSSVTERSLGTDDGHDVSSLDTSARSNATTDVHVTSDMDSSSRSLSERTASSFFLEGRKPLSSRPILEAKNHSATDKSTSNGNHDEERNYAREDQEEEASELSLGEEYLLVFQAMCSSCYGCAFLFFYLCISAGQSLVDNLIFLYFETMGASYLMMGYTIVITIGLELSVSYMAPRLLTYCTANGWLLIAGLAYVTRVVGYTMIPRNHLWMIWVLELLHGLTYAGTLTAVADFVAAVIPHSKEYQATAQHLISLLRGKAMTAAVFWGAWVQQEVGPQFMYRRAATLVLLAILSFWLALFMDSLFSISPASDIGFIEKRGKSCSDSNGGDEESNGEREESGRARRRPTIEFFQDPLTISWETQDIH